MKNKKKRTGVRIKSLWSEQPELRARLHGWGKKLREGRVEPGDILYVDRLPYKHYGIYAGEAPEQASETVAAGRLTRHSRIIHYSNGLIRETELPAFQRDAKCIHLCIPELNIMLQAASENFLSGGSTTEFAEKLQTADFPLYSPEETLKRARSRLGERNYDLADNNCEHFALWAKTGISGSSQVALHPILANSAAFFMSLLR